MSFSDGSHLMCYTLDSKNTLLLLSSPASNEAFYLDFISRLLDVVCGKLFRVGPCASAFLICFDSCSTLLCDG